MAERNTLILIPPSEGKKPDGDGKPVKPNAAQRTMIDRLLSFDGDWEKLLGVKGNSLLHAITANKSILTSGTMNAIERYTGVVYDGIDYPSLDQDSKRYFDKHIRILSAVFGLIKPKDKIPDYKLKIEKLDAANYWKPIIEKQLKNTYVIDLLPNAHRKGVAYDDGIAVNFMVEKGGKKTAAGHQGKFIKGRFVRWLCENQVSRVDEFNGFQEEGFHWNGGCFLKKV